MGAIFIFVVSLMLVNFINCAVALLDNIRGIAMMLAVEEATVTLLEQWITLAYTNIRENDWLNVLPGIDKCNLEDSACMTPAFQKAFPMFMSGLPDQGVEVLDVMNMDDVAFDLSGLQFSLKEGKLKGLKTSIVDSVKWNLKKKTLAVAFHMDSTVKGHYTASGRILILPITGDGQMKLKMKNILIKLILHYQVEKDAEGKDHMVPSKYSFEFDVRDNAHFTLTNLFNGNKELSDAMLTFLNENWKQISIEFGKPLVESASKKMFKNVKAFLQSVPISDIAQY